MEDNNIILYSIFDEASTFVLSMMRTKKRVSWLDYEYFKRKLHDAGLFGYECKLADTLGL